MLDIPLRIITNIDSHQLSSDVHEVIRESGGSIDDGVVKSSPCYSYIIYFRLPVEEMPKFYLRLKGLGLELTEESKALLKLTNDGRDFGGMWMEEAGVRRIAKLSVKLVINVIPYQSE